MYVSLGPARQWSERSPPRETLVESRAIKEGRVASVSAVGAAGVEVVEALIEAQDAVLLLVPYLNSLIDGLRSAAGSNLTMT